MNYVANLQLNAGKALGIHIETFCPRSKLNGMCAWFIKNNVESKMPLQYRTGDPVLTAQALVLRYAA